MKKVTQAELDQRAYAASVPVSVGPVQMRRALRQMGLMGAVKSYLQTADADTQEDWGAASEFIRTDPLMIDAQAALQATDAQMDALFVLAGSL